ncbi:MAG: GGDEF domain-containing protein [Halioglobus sp.]|nr:GGDEF domain-containing protein [Halioglobus sp.]
MRKTRPATTRQLRWLLLSLVLCSAFARAVTPVAVTAIDDRVRIGPEHLALLEDPAGSLSYAQVVESWRAADFSPSPASALNRGITSSVYWARLQITNPDATARRVILSHDYAPTDDVRVFTGPGAGDVRIAGDSVAPGHRFRNRVAAFELELPPDSSQTLYLRVATESNLNLELSLWPPMQFQWHEQLLGLAYGVLFGGVAVTVLYLLFAAQLARETNALLLAAYLTSYGLYLAFLNGFPSLWLPAALLPFINTLHLASMGLLFGFGALFFRRYLLLASQCRWADRVVALLQWLGFAVILSPLLSTATLGLILGLVAGLGPLFTIGLAFYLWYRRRPHASVFALGWTIAHLGSMLGTLRVSGVLPNSDLLLHLPAIGCAVAFAFFTWSIATRVSAERVYAYTDFLTGLANRRLFQIQGEMEYDRARRYDHPLSLVLLDVDHFKRVNDSWGHAFGDQVLRGLAQHCQKQSRASDLVVRLGGEEFAILLVETPISEARKIAERLRLAQMAAAPEGREITVSLGISELLPGDRGIEDLLQRADAAMYRAKEAGRNRTELQTGAAGLS